MAATEALREVRQMPIIPAKIHEIPNVTIQKLADALYCIGRAAKRNESNPEKMRSTLTP